MLNAGEREEIRDLVKLGVLEAFVDTDRGVPAMIARLISAHQQACAPTVKVNEAVRAHSEACPGATAMRSIKLLLCGALVGAFVAGGGSVLALAKTLGWM